MRVSADSETLSAAPYPLRQQVLTIFDDLLQRADQYPPVLPGKPMRAAELEGRFRQWRGIVDSLAEPQEAREGPAHGPLVRVADRVVRIRHWQDGEFL